jgi:hypothetical protein
MLRIAAEEVVLNTVISDDGCRRSIDRSAQRNHLFCHF